MEVNNTSRLIPQKDVIAKLIEHDEMTMKIFSILVIIVMVISYTLGFLVGRSID